jgi:hypothetical protein
VAKSLGLDFIYTQDEKSESLVGKNVSESQVLTSQKVKSLVFFRQISVWLFLSSVHPVVQVSAIKFHITVLSTIIFTISPTDEHPTRSLSKIIDFLLVAEPLTQKLFIFSQNNNVAGYWILCRVKNS